VLKQAIHAISIDSDKFIKIIFFGDGKQVNKESDADYFNFLCPVHPLHAKDT